MGLQDLVITPIYCFIFYLTGYFFRKKYATNDTFKYFFPGLLIKFLGAILLGVIYQFYYKGGDTYNYFFWGSKWIWEAFLDSPVIAFKILFSDPAIRNPEIYNYTSHMLFYGSGGADFVSRLAGFFSFFTFHTYSSIALFFALISFAGVWWLFSAIVPFFPAQKRNIFLALFCLPSTIIWGSGLMKDTLMLSAVGLIFGSIIRIFYLKERKFQSYVLLILSFWLVIMVKVYIAYCLLPAILLFVFMKFNGAIKNVMVKVAMMPLIIILLGFFSIGAVRSISLSNTKYSIENLAGTAKATAWWHETVSGDNSSGYTLGNMDYSTSGMIAKIIPAINVTLFRPYPWEVNSVMMVFSSLESLILLMLSIRLFIGRGFFKVFSIVSKSPILSSMLFFSLTFAFAIGLVTYNFGALVRYKIPILPIYVLFIIITNIYLSRKISASTKL